MKLCYKSVEVNGPGVVALIPEDAEDMWHAYNLISEGDSIRASTIRKVQTESATGSSSSNRVRTTLTVRVETVDFDTQACALRVKGRNIEENQYVKVSQFYQQMSSYGFPEFPEYESMCSSLDCILCVLL